MGTYLKTAVTLFVLTLLIACDMQDSLPKHKSDVPVNGTRLHVETIGEGAAVVFLHGGPGFGCQYMIPSFRSLGEDFRLVFFDQRASGKSAVDVPAETITFENLTNDIDSLTAVLGIDRFHLVSHSSGSLQAIHYASTRPQRLLSLVLINPLSGKRSEFTRESMARLQARQRPEDLAAINALSRDSAFQQRRGEAVERYFHTFFAASFHDRSLVDSLSFGFSDSFAEGSQKLSALNREMSNYDVFPQIKLIERPTMIIYGVDDPLPSAAVEKIRDHLPDGELHILEKSGHFPFIEQREETVELIRNFFRRNGQ